MSQPTPADYAAAVWSAQVIPNLDDDKTTLPKLAASTVLYRMWQLLKAMPKSVWGFDPNAAGQGGLNTPAWRPDASTNPTAAPAWFVSQIADMVHALALQAGIDLSALPAVTPAPAPNLQTMMQALSGGLSDAQLDALATDVASHIVTTHDALSADDLAGVAAAVKQVLASAATATASALTTGQ
jgi:hypothetical protein